jgi:hypothetical protein
LARNGKGWTPKMHCETERPGICSEMKVKD